MTGKKGARKIMGKVICVAMITAATCYFISISQASEAKKHEQHMAAEGSEIHLSHDLMEILNQEMNAIEQGMMDIIPAISRGNWEDITNIAKKIKNSFILKQKLTEKQIEELHESLPAEFIEMDHGFHSTAEKLAHAGMQQDGELVNFYYYKLHSQCMKCHSKYASERFTNLKKMGHGKDEHK